MPSQLCIQKNSRLQELWTKEPMFVRFSNHCALKLPIGLGLNQDEPLGVASDTTLSHLAL